MTNPNDHLRLGRGLTLDADSIAAGRLALLGASGAGKTYATRVLAEEIFGAAVQTVVVDPMGVCWGLRAGANGSAKGGIPIPVFGGSHGDAPLEPSAGHLMADLAVDEGLSMVLDLSEFSSRDDERTFAAAFFDRLYRRNRDLLHLIVDEADLFAPQRPDKDDAPVLRAMENIVRRGRNKGLGISMASQRAAVLNKNVLAQISALVALRVTAPQDRDTIRDWVRDQSEAARWEEIAPSLPNLANGESWWWVPEDRILKRVQIRKARTFDSSPTRKRGQSTRAPKTFADINMQVIADRMADTIERAKATDPAELQHRIRELEIALAKAQSGASTATPPEPVIVPAVDEKSVGRLEAAVAILRDLRADLGDTVEDLVKRVTEEAARVTEAAATAGHAGDRIAADLAAARKDSGEVAGAAIQPAPGRPVASAAKPARAARRPTATPSAATASPDRQVEDENGVLTPARLRILDAIAALASIGLPTPPRGQVALLAGVSPKTSGYANNLGALRTNGYIDYPVSGTVALTESGRAAASPVDTAVDTESLHEKVRSVVTPARWRILEPLIAAYPEALSREELAVQAGVSPSTSGYANNLGALRSLKLLNYPSPGYVIAASVLFIGEEA